MKAKTYDEWIELGYHVAKGEKSTLRNKAGVAVFTREQVEESNDLGNYRFSDPYDG